ncbi:MAG: hypothetical protein QG562_476 [Patescibacteria group bacterium]|nr:hypothetical protein [Patescibacteria group bacterium]
MIQKIIDKLMRRRHYWRTVSFDDLSELYVTQFLRSLSLNLIGIFVPIYLFKMGFDISNIAIFYFIWFLVRPIMLYPMTRLIGYLGPKHAMVFSVVAQIVYLTLVISIGTMQWPLWLLAVFGSLSYGLYRMAFDIDFSKVKHRSHGGKEIGYMQIFERFGGIVGPIVGGLVAGFIDPRYTFALAIVILLGSLIPLLATAEPLKQRKHVIIKGFPLRRYRRNILASGAYQIQEITVLTIWPLFLGAFVIVNNTYQIMGFLTAMGTVLAMLSALIIGKFVDNNKSKQLFNTGAYINSFILILQTMVTSALGVFVINFFREPLAAMYRIPFMKGRFDDADSAVGYRIVYFMYIEYIIAIFNVILWSVIYLLSTYYSGKFALQTAFIIAAIMSIVMTKQRFNALR